MIKDFDEQAAQSFRCEVLLLDTVCKDVLNLLILRVENNGLFFNKDFELFRDTARTCSTQILASAWHTSRDVQPKKYHHQPGSKGSVR